MNNTVSKFDERYQMALALKNQGNIDAAIEILIELTETNPDSGKAFGMAAALFWRKRDLQNAITFGRRAVELKPDWELPSACLFESLLATGDRKGAGQEMDRFLALKKSAHYSEFIKDLADEEKDPQKKASLLKLSQKHRPAGKL